ncbi:M phase phosphoprotein 10-like [Prosopis cineraria]|uniref:M phase phosphoprotein 10-like n=1 Tax=Prosopis cineraria TaxID=364024 RepID=UPI00240F6D52|nr:M phase phosphoprotein 10-like [Prosopis cineraria]XP_054799035.1 M phase phosphoprotein 10-like [Prosopis cineraria]
MLKQLTGRNQRTKGFKVKNSLQIFVLVAGCLWLLYQLKYSYDKKSEYEQNPRTTLEKLQFQHENPKLGRKGFQLWIKKPEDLIDDAEEMKPEKIKVRRGGRYDEMNGHDQYKMEEEDSEEVEDLIDEEDKETIEETEEEEDEDMGQNIGDISSLKDKSHDEGEKYGDKENKNGASRVMMRKTQSTGAEFEFRGLESSEKARIIKQQNKITAASKGLVPRTESIPKIVDKVKAEYGSFQTVLARRKDHMLDFSDSEAGSSSDSLLKMETIKPRAYHNLARISIEAIGSLQGANADENEKASDRGIGEEVSLKRARSL